MNNIITYPALWQHLLGAQGTHSFIDWITLACRDWHDETDLPGHLGPWKSIGEVQHIFRELGMRQACSMCRSFFWHITSREIAK